MEQKMSVCKSCGKEIAKNAKVCPHCGGKNGKAIYKKWWFWVIIVVICIGLIGGNSGGDDNAESGAEKQIEQNALAPEENVVEPVEENEPEMTMGQKNALKSAESYLGFTAFSYTGLIKQLEFEGYTTEEATFAADNCGADWNEQAAKSAKNYLSFTSFSRDGLIEQLEFEGFTHEQAVYGVEANGY